MSGTISEKLSALPEYLQYVIPLIEAQKELGGSAKPAKVLDRVIEKIGSSKKPSIQTAFPPCPSRIGCDLPKVRRVLIHAGLLDPSRKGVWTLTKKGFATDLKDIDLHRLNELRKKADKAYREQRKRKINGVALRSVITGGSKKAKCVHEDCRKGQFEQLKALPPADLEKVCQEVLRKSGFERVRITGHGSEDCFEGECVFQETPFRRSYVMFRYRCFQELIGEEEVRDFRRAMTRRADRGILITISSFTARARLEAQRDGVAPVILIDGNRLVGMIQMFKIQLETA